MKVRLQNDYEKIYTLEEYRWARRLIRKMNSDPKYDSVEPFVERAVHCALLTYDDDSIEKILSVDARTARNSGILNRYGDGVGHETGLMDVYITAYAKARVLAGIDYEDIIVRVDGFLTDFETEPIEYPCRNIIKTIYVEGY